MNTNFFSIFLIILLSACSDVSVTKNIELAQNAFDTKDYTEAKIYLKQAIQKDPKNIEARLLLASSYQAQGAFLSANKEWNKANELGANINVTTTPKLISLYVLDDNLAVIDFWDANESKLETLTKLDSVHLVILSLFKLNKIEESKSLLESVLSTSLKNNDKNHQAFYKILNDVLFTKAPIQEKINELIKVSKEIKFDLPLNLMLANLHFIHQNFKSAAEIYENVAISYPEFIEPVIITVESFLRQPNLKKAEFYINQLLYKYPNHPYINQLTAQLKIQQKKFLAAKKHIDIALLNGKNNPQLRLLAGLTYYQLDNNEQAASFLNGLEQYYPQNNFVQNIIISNKLKLGDHSNFAHIIDNKNNTELLSATSLALLDSNPSTSFELLEQLELNDIDNIADRNKMGIAKLLSNNISVTTQVINSAKKILNNKNSSDEDIQSSRFLLISALLKQGRIKDAESILEKWRSNNPKDIKTLLMIANIKSQFNTNESNQIYNEVLTLEADNEISLLKLGQYHFSRKHYIKASHFFQRITQVNKLHSQAIMGLYASISKSSNSSNALKQIESILLPINQENKNDQVLILANIYIVAENPYKALELLTSHNDGFIDRSRLAHRLLSAEANFQLHKFSKANSIYNKILSEELNLNVLRKKLLIHDMTKDEKQAVVDLKNLLIQYPDNLKLKIITADYLVDHNESDFALKLLEKINIPTYFQEVTQSTIAKALFYQKKYNEALIKFESLYGKVKNNQLAHFIFNSLINLDRTSDATLFIENHLLEKPEDINSRLLYANQLYTVNSSAAIEQYKKIIKISPNNIVVLNNLAWLLYEQGEFTDAKEYIDKAIALAPKNKNIIDTSDKINKALK